MAPKVFGASLVQRALMVSDAGGDDGADVESADAQVLVGRGNRVGHLNSGKRMSGGRVHGADRGRHGSVGGEFALVDRLEMIRI